MDEINRPRRRIKTRPPYDLRRKVLLKNFLREQMSPTHLQASSINLGDHEAVPLTYNSTSENEIIDIENTDSSNDAMIVDDEQNNIEMSSLDVEMDDSTIVEPKTSSFFKNSMMFDFTKITEFKLSQFNTFKKKTPTLSAEDVKIIADKNSVHLEKNSKADVNVKKNMKASGSIFKRKINSSKRKPTIEDGKKKGILKAKDMVKSSKFLSKQHQLDKSNHEIKSSKLNKVKKMIASVHHAIKGESPTFKMIHKDIPMDFRSQTHPQRKNSASSLRQYSNKSSKYGSFNNGILIDFEIPENEEDMQERIRARKKKQYFHKFKTQNPLNNKPSFKDNILSKILRRRFFNRCIRPNVKDGRFVAKNSDIIWSLNEIRRLEKANKRLKEENKLLSESLSSIMADVSIGSPSKRSIDPCSSRSNGSPNSRREETFHSPRRKVLRSRSVREERRREIKTRLSSHSMCHQPYSRTLYTAKPCFIKPYPSEEVPLPYRKIALDHSYTKPISRRSSMPERITKRPHVYRRSSFTLENKSFSFQDLLSLPDEAFY